MTEQQPSADTIESLLGEAVPTLSAQAGSGQYYLPASHIQLLEQLEHLSRYSDFVQVITGVTGIGKSTLLQQFYPGTDDTSVHACCIQAFDGMTAHALLAEIAIQLNLDSSSSSPVASLLQALIEHGELLKQISRQLLIVIDDAERLAIDALELLLNQLSTLPDDDVRPHIVLFATPAIKQSLSTPSVRDVVASSCHFVEIQPLNAEETNGLLEHSFHAVVARLNEQQKHRILADSLGLPGRIPRALDAVLTGTAVTPPPSAATQTTNTPQSPAPSAHQLQTEPVQALAETPQPAEPSTNPGRSYRALFWSLGAATLLSVIVIAVWISLPSLMELRPTGVNSPQLAQTNETDSTTERIQLQLDLNTEPESPPQTAVPAADDSGFEQRLAQARAALDAEQTLNLPEAAPSVPTKPKSAPPQQLQPAPIKTQQAITTTPESVTATTDASKKLVLKLPTDSTLAASPTATSQPATEPAQSFYGDGQKLISWKPTEYSLQMLGAREEKNIREFIAAMPDRKNLHYFFTYYKEKPWYVVIYGRYPNRAAAMTARGELPDPLRAKRPWARSIKGIQDDIRKGAK